ncbi:putative transaldolase-like protein [Cladobotryum mycophilum]|uniref:Transaldolase n=1 Tax=Cladobotryum mycophilum TaxID=491253 RepID=A0ABR0SLV4_9HYPO
MSQQGLNVDDAELRSYNVEFAIFMMPSLLDALRTSSIIDCDTFDYRVARDLGPFVDCTSNQAIAYFELSRTVSDGELLLHYDEFIKEAVQEAKGKLNGLQGGLSTKEFVVEILMVKLQLRVIPYVTGYVHIQTNPKLSYSAVGTVENAERIIAIFQKLAPELDAKRVCIKIPATWEGLQACRTLEAKGIATLATTMFCMEQAVLAADANCTYIAPYVNELKVHFETYVDPNKAFDFCREAQAYYKKHSYRTVVLVASLASVDDAMQLASVQHITIPPMLLQALQRCDSSSWDSRLGKYFAEGPDNEDLRLEKYENILRDESAWRLAFTRSGFGANEGKIVQAINYFSDFQEKVEDIVKRYTN